MELKILINLFIVLMTIFPARFDAEGTTPSVSNIGKMRVHSVVATCYQPTPYQTDDTPLITASGAKINPHSPLSHRWIAVSRDLEHLGYTFGSKVLVSGTCEYDGIWFVQDRMNKRWSMRIDFLVGINDYIDKWNNVLITKIY